MGMTPLRSVSPGLLESEMALALEEASLLKAEGNREEYHCATGCHLL